MSHLAVGPAPLSFAQIERYLKAGAWVSCELNAGSLASGFLAKAYRWIRKVFFHEDRYRLEKVVDAIAKRLQEEPSFEGSLEEAQALDALLRRLSFKVWYSRQKEDQKQRLFAKLDQVSQRVFGGPHEGAPWLAPALARPKSLQEALTALRATAIASRFPLIWDALNGQASEANVRSAFKAMSPKKKYMLACALLKETQLPASSSRTFKLEDEKRRSYAFVTGSLRASKPCSLDWDLDANGSRVVLRSFFTYQPDTGALPVIITDFSNKLYGGGALGEGFVQEEIMLLECPVLLEKLLEQGVFSLGVGHSPWRCRLQTRRPLDDGADTALAQEAGQGIPDPILFDGVRRHVAIEGIYGGQLGSASSRAVVESIVASASADYPFHVLAMAAPKLEVNAAVMRRLKDLPETTAQEQAHKERMLENPLFFLQTEATTILDLIATAFAGLDLSLTRIPSGQFVWRTGKLGCGAFNNHYAIAYLAQRYAAAALGIAKVEFYHYREDERRVCEDLWRRFEIQYKAQAASLTRDLSPQEVSCLISEVMTGPKQGA